VDLASPEHQLAIEVDGHSHTLKKWKFLDARKTSVLNALGWKVLRFWNQQVLDDLDGVVVSIRQSMT
jgi:very-short-patch-repair endonuclease